MSVGLWSSALLLLAFLSWLLIVAEGSYLGSRAVVFLYDRAAGVYDSVKAWGTRHDCWRVALPLTRALSDVAHPLVLDAATGTGRIPLLLADWPFFDGHIIGLDLSANMLCVARQRTREFRGVISLTRQDALFLSFADNTFHAVSCLEGLELFPRPEKALQEMARVLRPGGVLLISNRVGWEAIPSTSSGYSKLRTTGEDNVDAPGSDLLLPEDERTVMYHPAGYLGGGRSWKIGYLCLTDSWLLFRQVQKWVFEVSLESIVRLGLCRKRFMAATRDCLWLCYHLRETGPLREATFVTAHPDLWSDQIAALLSARGVEVQRHGVMTAQELAAVRRDRVQAILAEVRAQENAEADGLKSRGEILQARLSHILGRGAQPPCRVKIEQADVHPGPDPIRELLAELEAEGGTTARKRLVEEKG